MTLIFLILGLCYLAICLKLRTGLKNVVTIRPEIDNSMLPKCDIIISAKDEEHRIKPLMESLCKINYPKERYRITIVNDRSTDKTEEIVASYRSQIPMLNIITIETLPDGISPKKNALIKAITQTTGEIIAITDADSLIHPDWLLNLASVMVSKSADMVQGVTLYDIAKNNSALMKFQEIDFISHSINSGAFIGINLPINGNANNLAYKRSAFNECSKVYEDSGIVSGDDDLLLQSFWRRGYRILFQSTPEGTVFTQPEKSWRALFNQRMRWASKTVNYAPKQVAVLSIIFLFYCSIILSIPSIFLGLTPLSTLIILWTIKLIGEVAILYSGKRLISQKNILHHLIWASPLQLLTVFIAIIGGIFGSFEWKGVKYRRSTKK